MFDVRLRTTVTADSGTPAVTTLPGSVTIDLMHVVYTRDTAGVVRVYVDGVEILTDVRGGDFSNWNINYHFALANEVTRDRPWLGEMHLVAIYNRALTEVEVLQNYQAGLN